MDLRSIIERYQQQALDHQYSRIAADYELLDARARYEIADLVSSPSHAHLSKAAEIQRRLSVVFAIINDRILNQEIDRCMSIHRRIEDDNE